MKPGDLTGILMIAFLGGGIISGLGAIIRFCNIGDVLNFFDEEKHDKEKVSRIVGRDLLVNGVSVIVIAIISVFIDAKYHNAMMMLQAFILIFGLIIAFYHQMFKCEKS